MTPLTVLVVAVMVNVFSDLGFRLESQYSPSARVLLENRHESVEVDLVDRDRQMTLYLGLPRVADDPESLTGQMVLHASLINYEHADVLSARRGAYSAAADLETSDHVIRPAASRRRRRSFRERIRAEIPRRSTDS